MWKKIKHRLVYFLPPFLSQYVSLGKKWYESSGIYRFKIRDHIKLRCRNAMGYGVNPVGIVVSHKKSRKSHHDLYEIKMTIDVGNEQKKERHTQSEGHFKWNIENHFRKVRRNEIKKRQRMGENNIAHDTSKAEDVYDSGRAVWAKAGQHALSRWFNENEVKRNDKKR